MKFYGRQDELAELSKIRDLSREAARFTVVTGRRRVGKTELIDRAFNDGRITGDSVIPSSCEMKYEPAFKPLQGNPAFF